MTTSIENFWATVDQVYGAYLDANAGLHFFSERIAQIQDQTATSSSISKEKLDSLTFFYGKGDPNKPDSIVQHRVTQGQLKYRNRKNGENALFLGAMSIVLIYQFWEDHFRKEVATELKIPPRDLKHDLLGDLRLLRIAIIHNGSIAKKEIEKCKLLKWFKEGDEIVITEDRMHELIVRLRELCVIWLEQHQSANHNP